jgi:hypothetical protein
MESSESPAWPEADITEILKLEGIEPCERNYQTVFAGERILSLERDGVCISYKTRDLGVSKVGNSAMDFKAVIVNEDGKNKGAGIYYEVVEGGRGRGILYCGSKCYDDPKDGIGIVEFLSELRKK